MAQSFIRHCSHCGASASVEQQYCQHCGSSMEVGASTPTLMSRGVSSSQMPTMLPTPSIAQVQMDASPARTLLQPVSSYPPFLPAQSQKAGRGWRRAGCGLSIAVTLILVLLLGTAGFFLVHFINSHGIAVGGSNPDATPTQSPVRTTPLNETITYASVIITLINAQQTSRFVDDTSTSSVGALRLTLHESQAAPLDTGGSNTDPYYGYDKPFHLIVPGGKIIGSDSTKIVTGPTGKASQDNWIDFSVSPTISVNQLTLRLGDTNEAQMDVPLTAHANLSMYQPEIVHLATRVPYGSIFWTLTAASKQWSNGGKQAGRGQRFLVVAVSVDNPSSSDVNAYPPDYIRLQVGGNQIDEADDSMPLGFAAGTTGAKGFVAFLVPQESTSFALVLLGNGTANASSQATISFTIA